MRKCSRRRPARVFPPSARRARWRARRSLHPANRMPRLPLLCCSLLHMLILVIGGGGDPDEDDTTHRRQKSAVRRLLLFGPPAAGKGTQGMAIFYDFAAAFPSIEHEFFMRFFVHLICFFQNPPCDQMEIPSCKLIKNILSLKINGNLEISTQICW